MFKIFVILVIVLVPLKWIYVVDPGKCNGCGNCVYACTEGAITLAGGDAWIDPELCNGCGTCVYYCPRNAIYREWYTGIEDGSVETEGLQLSRNPVSTGSVTLTGAEPDAEITMVDASGRVVCSISADTGGSAFFDVSSLPRGSYRVVTGEELTVLSVI